MTLVTESDAKIALSTLLNFIEGTSNLDARLVATPERVLSSLQRFFCGYSVDPMLPNFVTLIDNVGGFDLSGQITLSDISFLSHCEHHLEKFSGVCSISYVPSCNRILGLGSIVRVVEAYSARLQIQERLTQQIGSALAFHLKPKELNVVMKASHDCLSCKNPAQLNATLTTTFSM